MIVSYVHNMLLHYCLNLSLCCVHDLYPGIFPEPTILFTKLVSDMLLFRDGNQQLSPLQERHSTLQRRHPSRIDCSVPILRA